MQKEGKSDTERYKTFDFIQRNFDSNSGFLVSPYKSKDEKFFYF